MFYANPKPKIFSYFLPKNIFLEHKKLYLDSENSLKVPKSKF